MSFAKEIVDVANRLKEFGHEIFLPEAVERFTSGKWQAGNPQLAAERKTKYDFIKKHYQKIRKVMRF